MQIHPYGPRALTMKSDHKLEYFFAFGSSWNLGFIAQINFDFSL